MLSTHEVGEEEQGGALRSDAVRARGCTPKKEKQVLFSQHFFAKTRFVCLRSPKKMQGAMEGKGS